MTTSRAPLGSRILSFAVASVVGGALLIGAALSAAPALAATTGAGISGITPYGGYLGNYIAPDGTRVYCIDASREWPSGATGPGVVTSTLTTSWGVAIDGQTMQKFDYALRKYGQTADPVQAAAMNAYLYAYSSGYARSFGASYDAGLHYIGGNATVAASYAAIWTDAETFFAAAPPPAAVLTIQMTDPWAGTVAVSTTPAAAAGVLTLTGAVAAESGDASIPVADGATVPIVGAPGDATTYTVSASATFQTDAGARPAVMVFETGDQQRTIRDSGPAKVEFGSTAQIDVTLPPPPPTPTPTPSEPPAPLTLAATGLDRASTLGSPLAVGGGLVAFGFVSVITMVRSSRRRSSSRR
jgi:hypothetical protein